MTDVQSLVNEKIKAKKVMMFSKKTCPFCNMAKEVFDKLINDKELGKDEYEVMELDGDPKCSAFQDYLKTLTGARTVPRVFINGKCIGGGSEVTALYKDKKLVPLLKVQDNQHCD